MQFLEFTQSEVKTPLSGMAAMGGTGVRIYTPFLQNSNSGLDDDDGHLWDWLE